MFGNNKSSMDKEREDLLDDKFDTEGLSQDEKETLRYREEYNIIDNEYIIYKALRQWYNPLKKVKIIVFNIFIIFNIIMSYDLIYIDEGLAGSIILILIHLIFLLEILDNPYAQKKANLFLAKFFPKLL